MSINASDIQVLKDVFGQWTCFLLAFLGIGTNLVNIIVFSILGFQETTNISLFAIAIFELLRCLSGFMYRLHDVIQLIDPAFSKTWITITSVCDKSILAVTGALVNSLTAYVSFERCLCVSLPFKVKNIITPFRTYVAVVVLTAITMITFFHAFLSYDIVWLFSPVFNRTLAYGKLSPAILNNPRLLHYISVNSSTWSCVTFIVIVTCTVVLMIYLRRSRKFRSEQTSAVDGHLSDRKHYHHRQKTNRISHGPTSYLQRFLKNPTRPMNQVGKKHSLQKLNKVSNYYSKEGKYFKAKGKGSPHPSRKEQQLAKMLLAVVAGYMLNAFPSLFISLIPFFIYDFLYNPIYANVQEMVLTVGYVLYFINASTNLFIFLKISTKFRSVFRASFRYQTQPRNHLQKK